MDAVYRRMNAALRAKLMDPMELNLNPKSDKKKRGKKRKRLRNVSEEMCWKNQKYWSKRRKKKKNKWGKSIGWVLQRKVKRLRINQIRTRTKTREVTKERTRRKVRRKVTDKRSGK